MNTPGDTPYYKLHGMTASEYISTFDLDGAVTAGGQRRLIEAAQAVVAELAASKLPSDVEAALVEAFQLCVGAAQLHPDNCRLAISMAFMDIRHSLRGYEVAVLERAAKVCIESDDRGTGVGECCAAAIRALNQPNSTKGEMK